MRIVLSIVVLALALAWSTLGRQDRSTGQPTQTSKDPDLHELAGAILEASKHTRLLCLGETHGSTSDAKLRSALLSHPYFPSNFDLILFEGASGFHQDLLDAFVLDGVPHTREELAPIWLDAGRGVLWQLPMYEKFIRDVRRMNLGLPTKERVRLLGAGPPIPWEHIETSEQLLPWLDRTAIQRQQIRRAVFETGQRAMAVFGRLHCEKHGNQLANQLEQNFSGQVFSTFSLNHAQAEQARKKLGLAVGPELLVLQGSRQANQRAEAAFQELHIYNGALFGEILDAVISYGENRNQILTIDEDALGPIFSKELRRRDALRSAAYDAH